MTTTRTLPASARAAGADRRPALAAKRVPAARSVRSARVPAWFLAEEYRRTDLALAERAELALGLGLDPANDLDLALAGDC